MNIDAELGKVGFAPPDTVFVRADPRGPEYGTYVVTFPALDRSTEYEARFIPVVGSGYTMYFKSGEELVAWGKEMFT